MIMKRIIIILLSAILLFSASCDSESMSCFKKAGTERTQNESLPAFNTITINSNFKLTLNQAANHSISITAGKNLIPHVKFEVINNELVIEDHNKCNWLRDYTPIQIQVNLTDLRVLNIYHACDIYTKDTIKVQKLIIENRADILNADFVIESEFLEFRSHASTGDYRFRGYVDHAYIYNIGNGYFFGGNMSCKTMHLVHRSLGRAILYVNDLLMIEDIKFGKVELRYGCPEIELNDNDFGELFENFGC